MSQLFYYKLTFMILVLAVVFIPIGGCTEDLREADYLNDDTEVTINKPGLNNLSPNFKSRRFNIPVQEEIERPGQQTQQTKPTFEHRVEIKTDGVIRRNIEEQWWIKDND